MTSKLQGRVVAITGAASGIGRALAIEVARRGGDVALCDIGEAGLAETAASARALGAKVSTMRVDVADRAAVHRFAEASIAEHGRVDAIVNNAGVSLTQTFAEMTYEDLEWILGINLWGVIHGTKAFLPHLLERNTGWIVNVSSVFGFIGVPTQSAYNIAKFGVRGMTESLRQELDETGICVSVVHPGGIRTNIVRGSRFYQDDRGATDKDEMVRNFDSMARTTPEQAAKVIADGMERRSPRILIGTDAYVIDAIARSAPEGYPVLLSRLRKLRRRGAGVT